MTRLRSWTSRFASWAHPDVESLLLWAEGESRPRVEAHLAWCGNCREHAALLRDNLQTSSLDETTTALVEDLFETLQLRMRAVGDGRHDVTAAVEHYFGKQAVSTLASSSHRDASGVRLMSTAQPLFNAFLGRKAADALTRRLASVA